MNKITRFFTCIVIFTVLLVSCKTAEFGYRTIDVSGMIYDFSNRPVAHCEVSLGRRFRSSTDINGRFTIPKVPQGFYTISVHKNGFEPYSEGIIIRDPGQIIYIRIPSQNQLLNLVDEALTANNITLAEEIIERAFHIDNTNIEMLFYYATVKFRQNAFEEAVVFLETAKNLGSRDLYIDKFLTLLKERLNAY